MTTADLAEEFTAATADAKRDDFDHLIAQGVPYTWLWLGPMRFGITNIITTGATYEPMEHGKRAFIMPAVPLREDVLDNDVGDLIAWHPENPEKWWCRLGALPFLNFEAVERAAHYHEPLRLRALPLSWLKSGGQGAVILDQSAHLPLWLGGVSKIIFEDLVLAKRVKARMRKQERQLPAFYIEDARAAA
jgi:hypothetical protein